MAAQKPVDLIVHEQVILQRRTAPTRHVESLSVTRADDRVARTRAPYVVVKARSTERVSTRQQLRLPETRLTAYLTGEEFVGYLFRLVHAAMVARVHVRHRQRCLDHRSWLEMTFTVGSSKPTTTFTPVTCVNNAAAGCYAATSTSSRPTGAPPLLAAIDRRRIRHNGARLWSAMHNYAAAYGF